MQQSISHKQKEEEMETSDETENNEETSDNEEEESWKYFCERIFDADMCSLRSNEIKCNAK